MGLILSNHCCRCRKRTSVDVLPPEHYRVIILGLPQSGKTEVGHVISGIERKAFEPTNGAQFYRTQPKQLNAPSLLVTEIGGNLEMQKIWHHYFITSMGIIYCFDMSSRYEELRHSFELLQKILSHPFIRGKPVLVVGTKSDLANCGLSLYDIENEFCLEKLASQFLSSLHLCYYGRKTKDNARSLHCGVNWLLITISQNCHQLSKRVKTDANYELWHQRLQRYIAEGLTNHKQHRFKQKITNATRDRERICIGFGSVYNKYNPGTNLRPMTAPARVFYIAVKHVDQNSKNLNNT